MAIEISLEAEGSTRMASGYFPGYDIRVPPELAVKLVIYCERRVLPLLLDCDANSHHEIWGSSDTKRSGEYFLELILSNKLEIYNIGNTAAFVTSIRQEVLDITLGSTVINGLIRNWIVVSDEPFMSDHRIIRFDIEGDSQIESIIQNARRMDCNSYATHQSKNLVHLQGVVTSGANWN